MQTLHDERGRGFASDNWAGAHREVLEALAIANGGHQPSYGGDAYTARLSEVIVERFGPDAEVFPVFNGTGANVLCLQALLPRWGAVICCQSAHIHADENGASERVGGLKLLEVRTLDGKLSPGLIDEQAWGWGDEHRAQPLAVSITQSTELGTVYTASEVAAIAEHVHRLGMFLHMDGARLANAAAFLSTDLKQITTDAGVDILSLGGTKNGLLFGEAVVVINPESVSGLPYLRMMNMQLSSKMRFISAQLVALFEGDLWLRSAKHANEMARRLANAIEQVDRLKITQPVESNAVFVELPADILEQLRKLFRFNLLSPRDDRARWMCAFDTTESDIDTFASAIVAAMNQPGSPHSCDDDGS